MKCQNCGYEIARTNIKTCPCCGNKIIPVENELEENSPAEEIVLTEKVTVEQEIPFESLRSVETPDPVEPQATSAPRVQNEYRAQPEPRVPREPRVEDTFVMDINSRGDMEITTTGSHGYNADAETSYTHDTPQSSPQFTEKEELPLMREEEDEYLENGSFQPYPDEIEEEPGYEPESEKSSGGSLTWVITIVAALVGLLLGCLLYYGLK